MKRIFMRALWGKYDSTNNITQRRKMTDEWLEIVRDHKWTAPFVTYVFGEENYKMMVDFGFDCRLVDKNPLPFDVLEAQYRHKLEALKYAFESDGATELVHMDWDVIPIKPLPDDFWEKLNEKESLQGCLQQYKRRKCYWRGENDTRKLTNGGFLYIRDPEIPNGIIKLWEENPGPSMEPALSKFIDQMSGYYPNFPGLEKYWELYEIECCKLHTSSAFPSEMLSKKDPCFIHYQGGNKNKALRKAKKFINKINKM